MRKSGLLILGMLMCFVLIFMCGCERRSGAAQGRVLAEVNGYQMTEGDYNYEKRPFLNYGQIQGDPANLKNQILTQLITRQLLLQEAQRLNLDKDKVFMKEIENYWKQALLTALLKKKSEELKRSVAVTEDEIEQEYRGLQPTEPLEKMRPEIRKQLIDDKTAQSLDAWVNKLTREARIKIYQQVLEDLKVN